MRSGAHLCLGFDRCNTRTAKYRENHPDLEACLNTAPSLVSVFTGALLPDMRRAGLHEDQRNVLNER